MFHDIGAVSWANHDLLAALDDFLGVYEMRPLRDNAGGVGPLHSFYLWFLLRRLRPAFVIESGVWKGQSTWLIEKAAPEAAIFAIEPDLDRVVYRSPNAEYLDIDFARADWRGVEPARTVVFFDDHRNALDRLRQCLWAGFRHIVFEDNYAAHGDCYSMRRILGGTGFRADIPLWPPSLYKVRRYIERYLSEPFQRIGASTHDRAAAMKHIETYYEFPPVFRHERTRWGDAWDSLGTKPALLEAALAGRYPAFHADTGYTWFAYVALKAG